MGLEESEEFELLLRKTHSWPRDFSSIKRGANKIIELATANDDVPRWRPLRWVIEAKDSMDFKRHVRMNPLHPNKNYSSGYHEEDSVYKKIAERISRDRPAI